MLMAVCLLQACDTTSYSWNEVNQLTLENNQLIVAGSKTGISKTSGIKSPYLSFYDLDLNLVSSKSFQTETTTLNPSLTRLKNGSKVFYFYRAESPDLQTEHSHLLLLDQDFKLKHETKFGHRTRITKLEAKGNDWISYQYERAKLNCSISNFVDTVQTNTKSFALSKESNIPIDMILHSDTSIFIAGIANGFHHRDGHQYLNERAYDFILKLDGEFEEQKRYTSDTEQHSFVNDLHLDEQEIILTGTEQNDSTGMDVKIQVFSLALEEKQKLLHRSSAAQKGIKSLVHNGQIFTLAETSATGTKNILLLQSNHNGQLIKETVIRRDESFQAKDMLVADDHLFIIANRQKSRTADMQAIILKLELDGKLVEEKMIQ